MKAASSALVMRPPMARIVDRLAIAFLLALLAGGSVALWIAVPLGCINLAWRLAGTSADAYLLALAFTIGGMIACGALLIWINRLYLRVSGVIARYEAEEERYGPGSSPRFLRGPLEPLLVSSLLVAIVVLVVWFVAFAHSFNPSISVAP